MSRERLKKMATLLKLAEQQEAMARQALGQVRQQIQQQETAIDQLSGFNRDYRQQLANPGAQYSGWALHSTEQFSGQIDQMIDQQRDRLVQLRQLLQARENQWLEARKQLKLMEQLKNRLEKEETVRLTREEQKALDEIASGFKKLK